MRLFQIIDQLITGSYREKCQEGHFVTVYTNIDKIMPIALKDKENMVDAVVGIKDRANAAIKTSESEKISHLLLRLDKKSSRIIVSYRLAYIAFAHCPCKNEEKFNEQVSDLLKKKERLDQFETEMIALLEITESQSMASDEVMKAYYQIVKNFRGCDTPSSAELEIHEAKEDAHILRGLPNDS